MIQVFTQRLKSHRNELVFFVGIARRKRFEAAQGVQIAPSPGNQRRQRDSNQEPDRS